MEARIHNCNFTENNKVEISIFHKICPSQLDPPQITSVITLRQKLYFHVLLEKNDHSLDACLLHERFLFFFISPSITCLQERERATWPCLGRLGQTLGDAIAHRWQDMEWRQGCMAFLYCSCQYFAFWEGALALPWNYSSSVCQLSTFHGVTTRNVPRWTQRDGWRGMREIRMEKLEKEWNDKREKENTTETKIMVKKIHYKLIADTIRNKKRKTELK